MNYTQLTTKELIGQTMGVIKEYEGKCHLLELQIKMNRVVKARYLAQQPLNKNGAESARQQIAKDLAELTERQFGLPTLLAHLAELQELDAAEDAAKEAATEQASDDTVSDLDEAPIDLTDEAEPEPTPIKARTRRGAEAPASDNHADARELVPV